MQTLAYHRPRPGTLTGRVWDVADEITRATGRQARRGEVIDRIVAEGGNPNTASTQFHHWKEHRQGRGTDGSEQGEDTRRRAIQAGSADWQRLTVAPDGRLLIPAAMREAMHLGKGGAVSGRVVDGVLEVKSPAVAVRQIQRMLKDHVPDDVSLADDLIADRRAEVGRDDR